jgi:6-pyruvoyltetrahydropterin/6-carboxytetrahydropterin synthase
MANYEISIETTFSAAHALRLPDGTLEPLHGHDWRVRVSLASGQLDAMDCVADFHEVERIVKATVAPWRHGNLNIVGPFCVDDELKINPSAERVAQVIAEAVLQHWPKHTDAAKPQLISVAVGEAPGCTATYRP